MELKLNNFWINRQSHQKTCVADLQYLDYATDLGESIYECLT